MVRLLPFIVIFDVRGTLQRGNWDEFLGEIKGAVDGDVVSDVESGVGGEVVVEGEIVFVVVWCGVGGKEVRARSDAAAAYS